MSAAVDLRSLPGWETAPRVWVGEEGFQRRVVDPLWLADATRKLQSAQTKRQGSEEWFEEANARCDDLVRLSVDTPRTAIREVIEAIAREHRLRVADLTGYSRNRTIVLARQHAIWALKDAKPMMSTPQIGRVFRRDHTTIIHALRAWPQKAAKWEAEKAKRASEA